MKKSGKGPKLSKRALGALQKAEGEEKPNTLQTSEDYLEQGTIDEESGDRWLGSDLAKAIRFYQKAYTSYLIALKKPIDDDNIKLDIFYNMSRLLYHVYNHYFQTEGIYVDELYNIDEVLHNEESVIQELATIVKIHETTIELSKELGKPVSNDLLYNTGLVYTQVIEEQQDNEQSSFIDVVNLGIKNQDTFKLLLSVQVNNLHNFVLELDSMNQQSETHPIQAPEGGKSTENVVGEEVLQPPDIFDTVLSCYKLSQAMVENISSPQQQIPQLKDIINPFLFYCDEIATQLMDSFSESNNTKAEYLSSITSEQINEYRIGQVSLKALMVNDLTDILQIWDQALPGLPEIPDKYLVLADNIQEFLDRNDLTLSNCNASEDSEMINGFWKSLTLMTNNLKKAQDLLTASKQSLQAAGADNLGTTLAVLSNVIIKRSDIDLQRCQLNHDQSHKNKTILLQNCKTFLKNAMNTANVSGGLRERVSEKHTRTQKKVEAVLRMCILEGKTSVQELDSILGRSKWTRELPNLIKLEYFDNMGIQNIQPL